MSRRIVLAGIAAIFAAMLGRMGWIDWPGVLGAAGLVIGAILALLVGAAIFIALPVCLLWAVVRAIIKLVSPGKPKPTTPAPAKFHPSR